MIVFTEDAVKIKGSRIEVVAELCLGIESIYENFDKNDKIILLLGLKTLFKEIRKKDFGLTLDVETITPFDVVTNGDIIKSMFPNIEVNEIKTDTGGYIEVKYLDTTNKSDATAFRKNWWYAHYRGGNSDDR